MLSHYNLTTNLIQYKATVVDYGSSDTFFAILPFFHIYGMIIVKSFALYLVNSFIFF